MQPSEIAHIAAEQRKALERIGDLAFESGWHRGVNDYLKALAKALDNEPVTMMVLVEAAKTLEPSARERE